MEFPTCQFWVATVPLAQPSRISHDGSMVLLYMVCHESHQYTPFMLAFFYQHHGSVMGIDKQKLVSEKIFSARNWDTTAEIWSQISSSFSESNLESEWKTHMVQVCLKIGYSTLKSHRLSSFSPSRHSIHNFRHIHACIPSNIWENRGR